MLHMNRVTLLGHAGRDPKGRDLNSGERTASFALATSRRWKGEGGEAVEKTDWHRVVVYGGAVKPVEEFVRKGSLVLVEGRLATREYSDRKGVERQVTEVIVAWPQGVVNVLSPKRTREAADEASVPETGDGDGAAGDGGEDA